MTEWGQQLSEMSNRRLFFWIVIGLVGIHSPAQQLWDTRAVSWLLLGGGIFITTDVFNEAASNTRPGQYLGGWWRRIGISGRCLAILTFAVVAWVSIGLYSGSLVPLWSFVCGLFLGLIGKSSLVLVRRKFNN